MNYIIYIPIWRTIIEKSLRRNKINPDIKNYHITQKIILLLLLPSISFLILTVLFYAYIEETTNDSIFINISGQQRMLSQQMLSLTQMVNAGQKEDQIELQIAINNFESSLQILERGGTISKDHHLPPASGETKIKINVVNEHWS